MKRAFLLVAFVALSAHAAVQTPSQFLGFEVGADKNLADYKQIVSYFRALVREGKSVILVTCNIHSSEIASSQMAMEWANALATANDPETKKRLDNVVLLLVPSLNPDGENIITD